MYRTHQQRWLVIGGCIAVLFTTAATSQAAKKNVELEQAALAFFNFPGSIHLKKDQRAQVVTIYSDIVPKLQAAQLKYAAAKEKERVAMLNTKVNMRSLRKGTGPSLPPEVQKELDAASKEYQTIQTEANQRAFNVLDDNQKRIINPNFDAKPAAGGATAGDDAKAAKGSDASDAKKKQ